MFAQKVSFQKDHDVSYPFVKIFSIKTIGGPFAGETRTVQTDVLGWPPPINLPGIFHGGEYLREQFTEGPQRVAEYVWAEYKKGEDVFAP